jgi:GNAT superfamily N-acetyltransferase
MTIFAADVRPQSLSMLSHELRPPASDAEWAALRRIQRLTLRDRNGRPYPAEPKSIDADRLALVLVYRGSVVGTVRLDRLDADRVALRHVAIDPVRQGEGHGAQLVDMAEALASAQGAVEVVLHAVAGSVAFYEKLGYQSVDWDEPAEHATSINLGKLLVAPSVLRRWLEPYAAAA